MSEQNYAQIEKENLAVVFAIAHFPQYVYGRKVTVGCDHKPLQAIVTKPLASAPNRLQCMILVLQQFDYEICYRKRCDMRLADALSRAPMPLVHTQATERSDTELLE